MKSTFKILAISISLLVCNPAFSQSPTEALSACMVDNLNGKERKNLAKWIFFAMGTHPEIKSYLNVSQKDVRATDEYVGTLITRLLTVDCPDRLKTAYNTDPASMVKAFEIVGKVAMQELTTNNEVDKAISNYARFADLAKIQKAMK